MIKHNAAKNTNLNKNKLDIYTCLYGNNERNFINNFRSNKNIRGKLNLQTLKKNYELYNKNEKEKNIFIESEYTNKKKSDASPNNKIANINNLSGNKIFKSLLNECLSNITQQANMKNIIIDNKKKTDKKFFEKYKLNYLSSKRENSRTSSDNNFKSNISSDHKTINKNKKSLLHKNNFLQKKKFLSLMHFSPKLVLRDEHNNLKIRIAGYDEINNIKSITNKSNINTNSNIKFSERNSKNTLSVKKKTIINLSKKIVNEKSPSRNTDVRKINSNINRSPKDIQKLNIEQSNCSLNESKSSFKHNNNLKSDKKKPKRRSSKSNKQLKFRINKFSSFQKPIIIEQKKKLFIPDYIKNSSVIKIKDISNLPFLNNNMSNEDYVVSSNLKQIIKKNITYLKSCLFESSFEREGTKKIKRRSISYTAKNKLTKIKSPTNKEALSGDTIVKSEIKGKRTFSRNNKRKNKIKNKRKIKEEVSSDKNINNKNNFLLETPSTLQLLNEKKVLIDNMPAHTNNSNNSSINDNSNSQIILLNKNNQKSNFYLPENNEFKKGKTNNKVFLKKVNSKLYFNTVNKYFMELENFRNLERKNIIYDSFDDEEIYELDENTLCLSPNSFVVFFFDIYIALSSIISIVVLPLNLARNKKFCRNCIFDFDNFLVYVTEVIYFIDLIMGFFKMYYNFEEQLIKDHSRIVKHYLKGNFALDLISAIPLLSLKILKTPKCNINNNIKFIHKYYNYQLNDLSDLLKLVKIIKIIKILNDNVFIKLFYKFIDEFDSSEKIITYITYISVVAISLHFATCLNIFISRNSYPNWIISLNMQNEFFSKIYMTSLYHIITSVTTVGYGDITPRSFREYIFQLIILLIGIVAYSWMVSSFSNYIKKNSEKYIEYENKLRILEDIKLKNPKISPSIYKKVYRHLNYGMKKGKNDYNIIFEMLPYSLKNTLIYEMYKPIINNFTILKNSQNSDFVISIIMALKPFSAIKNDLIVKYGDILEEMIFVKKGKISIEISINKKYQKELIETYLSDQLFNDDKIFLANSKKRKKKSIIVKTFNSTVISLKNSYILENSNIFPSKIDISSINKTASLELNKCSLKKDTINQNENNDKKDETILRILDIRRNEYFGDILMFLGYKSPINIRVKSKNVELFLLRKVDAINISITYKNIWNKINEKSTFNIEQIKSKIQKIVKQYCQSLGIKIDNNKIATNNTNNNDTQINTIKNKCSKNKQITNINDNNDNNDNKYSSIISNKNFNSASNSGVLTKESQKSLYSIIKKMDDKKNKINKNVIKSYFSVNKQEKNEKFKDSSSLNFESAFLKEKEIKNTIKAFKYSNLLKLPNEFYENSNIKSNGDKNNAEFVSINEFKKNSSHASNNAKYLPSNCQYSNFNSDENDLTPYKAEEINDEIYPGEIFEVEKHKNFNNKTGFLSQDKEYKNHSSSLDNDLIKNGIQKKKIKENDFNKNNNTITKIKFSDISLTETKNFSLEYQSMYDNLNQLTKYQYSKDKEIQIKTKTFLENIYFNNNSIKVKDINNDIINFEKTKMNSDTNEVKNIKDLFNDDSFNINKRLINTKISENSNKCLPNNLFTVKNNQSITSNTSQNINNCNNHRNKRRSSVSFFHVSPKKFLKESNNNIITSLKWKAKFCKSCQKVSSFVVPCYQNNNNSSIISPKKIKKTNKSNKLLNMVNKNIKQNSQNINNPEMFYSGLFYSLMKKQKQTKTPENKKSAHKNNHNISLDKENQNCELSFNNNKEKTFSHFDFTPLANDLNTKMKRNRKNKKYLKV